MSKEAMKLALEALESCTPEDTSTSHVIYAWHDEELVNKAIKALEEAQSKQEQGEPVGFIGDRYNGKMSGSAYPEPMAIWINQLPPIGSVLYTTPQQRTWEGLTDEERSEIINANFGTGLWFMAHGIEAKLKEKNT